MIRRTKLGNVLRLHRGYDITKAVQRPGPYPIVSSSGVGSYHDEHKFTGPGVVIGRKGSLGTAFYIPGPYWPHDTTLYVEDFKGNDPRYCYYLLKTMRLERFDVGAANPTLNRNHVHELEVDVVDVHAQFKTASILSAYDELIENNERRIAILAEMARRTYEEWFVHFRVPGCEDLPLVDSPVGQLPHGWEVARLGQVSSIVMGQSPPSNTYNTNGVGLPFHQGVSQFGDYFPTDKVYCTDLGRRADSGDLLVSVRAPVGRINIALSKMIIGRGLSAIRPVSEYSNLVCGRLRNFFKEEDSIGHGTIYKAVGRSEIENILVPMPPAHIAKAFEAFCSDRWALIRNLTLQNRNFLAQRDLVLPKLISGGIDLSEVQELREAAE